MGSSALSPTMASTVICNSQSGVSIVIHNSQSGSVLQKANTKVTKAKNVVVNEKNILTSFRDNLPVANTIRTSQSVSRNTNSLFNIVWRKPCT